MDGWYGKFDIQFVGAMINCTTPLQVNAVHRFLNGTSDSHYIDLFKARNQQEFTGFVWYNTTYFHESRHVHDYLLFPSLNTQYYSRLLSILYTVNALEYGSCAAEKLGYNVLPIPLSKWFKLNRSSQEEMLREWSEDGFTASAPLFTLPDYTIPRTQSYEHMLDGQDSYTRSLVHGCLYHEHYRVMLDFASVDQYDRSISIKSLLEASAVAVQAYAAESLYGNAGIVPIMETIRDAQLYENYPERRFSEYSTVFSRVYNYLHDHKTLDTHYFIPFVSILMSWCFSGNIYEKGSYNPVHRFRAFINNDYGKGLSFADIIKDPQGVFARWDNLYGLKPLNMAEYNLKQRAQYEKLFQACKDAGNQAMALYVEMIAKASQRMTLIYMDNPLNYILPNKYLEHFTTFTNIPICYSIKNGYEDFSDVPAKDHSKNGSVKSEHDRLLITINLPQIKLKIGEPALCYRHVELVPEISMEFSRYGNFNEAVYGEAPEGYDFDLINQFIAPQEVRFVF